MMYFQKSHFIIVAFYIQMVYSQDLTLTKKNPPYFCEDDLTLKCQYSGTSACCSAGTRVWRLNNNAIMTDGIATSNLLAGKYKEAVNVNGKYFELTIKNIDPSDFGSDYMCVYFFNSSQEVKSKKSRLKCKPCYVCGPRSWGWVCFGSYKGCNAMLCILLVIIWRYDEDNDTTTKGDDEDNDTTTKDRGKLLLLDGLITFILSIVLGAITATPAGIYGCICYEFEDEAYAYYPDPLFFIQGYFVVCLTLMLLAKFHAFNALTGTDVVILLLVLLTGPIGMIGLLGYAVYIFKYIKKKTWRDVQCKDVAIVILLIFTYGMVIPIAWKVWRVGATKTPKTPPDEPMKRRNVEDDHEPMNGRNVVD